MAFLILRDGLVVGQDVGQGEEAGLHDGVDALTHAGGLGHLAGVDGIDLQLLVDDVLLHRARQLVPQLFSREGGVQQEGGAGGGIIQHVVLFQEDEVVAGDEFGVADQIGRLDRMRAEAQMADGHRARLLRIIDEVALGIQVGGFGDDLDGVLVGAHGAVGAQAEEDGAAHVLGLQLEVFVPGQGQAGDIVVDADGEAALGGCPSAVRRTRP